MIDADSSSTTVRRNRLAFALRISVDGRIVGFTDYRAHGGTLIFPHTAIEGSMHNRGLGQELVRAALDCVRARDGAVVAPCWYVAEFIYQNSACAGMLADT